MYGARYASARNRYLIEFLEQRRLHSDKAILYKLDYSLCIGLAYSWLRIRVPV